MTTVTVRVPNFKPGEPNVNGHIFDETEYLEALDKAIKSEHGLMVTLSSPVTEGGDFKVDLSDCGGKIVGYSYKDNEAGLLLDVKLFQNDIGVLLAECFGISSHLFASVLGTHKPSSVEGHYPMEISNIAQYYWEGQISQGDIILEIPKV